MARKELKIRFEVCPKIIDQLAAKAYPGQLSFQGEFGASWLHVPSHKIPPFDKVLNEFLEALQITLKGSSSKPAAVKGSRRIQITRNILLEDVVRLTNLSPRLPEGKTDCTIYIMRCQPK